MLFGLDPKLPHDSTVRLLRSAKGVIVAADLNVGLQAGSGATISLGGLF
ncbi:hypothetical protein ALQ33_01741 [Pseudomonas syringae pv. philadelphi]|uniref:Uncharacterized protein n=1 Tax=Pseudomonas syringae pv. philadelphi TaxID=251706 RepID=A0A3M3ZQS2_9PSED|nr:hypothetical protein [Pseudomonas syringae group genomosp. 3]RMO97016.1 hypothetical protein ALQ33_01741 [Pseudomonas syringae pv. philadelphi]